MLVSDSAVSITPAMAVLSKIANDPANGGGIISSQRTAFTAVPKRAAPTRRRPGGFVVSKSPHLMSRGLNGLGGITDDVFSENAVMGGITLTTILVLTGIVLGMRHLAKSA